MKKTSKIFVLDTNVFLHDFKCIYNFQDNDIVIPIVALEELDKFKKGNDIINYHAREFTRELDKLAGSMFFSEGVSLGKDLGKMFVETGKEFSDVLKETFPEKTPDHRILAIADYIRIKNPNRKVILVTKDINLRLKANAIGLIAEDYKTDKVENLDALNQSSITVENIPDELINKLYEDISGIPADQFKLDAKPKGQQDYIFKSTTNSALVRYDPSTNNMIRIEKQAAYGIKPRNAEQTFALDALMRTEVQLVGLTGKAGTGKTLLALAAALHQRKHYKQILLARPIISLANRDLGFLPGDVNEKIGPYMLPLFDNLAVIKHQFNAQSREYLTIEEMLAQEKLVITPLAYIRGRSLSDVYFIVDEAQNLTPHEVKTIITRAGEGTKMVFTGDIQQIDSPYLDSKSNGLSYLSNKMLGQDLFSHVHLEKGERSYLAELASNLL
ncbi:MAG: PhoH family protein [Bacteroidia bacterium]|nr:PhoH family protein [Bacteroidia bacterium]